MLVSGRLQTRNWEDNGERRTAVEIEAEEVAASLRWATVAITKVAKPGANVEAAGQAEETPAQA